VTDGAQSLWGPRLEADGTRFRLWAPDRDDVRIEIGNAASHPMKSLPDGWREAFQFAPPGTPYRFRIGDTAVPDPASRAQRGADSVVADPASYRWRNAAWRGRSWEETVLYELHPGLMGGFKGIAERLPALADLGVTAIELMPIAQFPGARNWGYDGVLPFAPDETYGAPDDLKRLIDEAHGLGLMVFLDVVYNHFGPDGNYLPLYAKRFFREDRHTPWGAAIDFHQPAVTRFFVENALYWVREFRIDGLRFDAVHAIRDDGFLHDLAREIRAAVPGRAVHLVVENENNDAALLEQSFDAQWNDDFHHALHVLLTGESAGYYADYAHDPAAKLARALGEGFVYQGEPSHNCGRPRGTASAHLPPASFVAFLQNHDHTGNRAFGERLSVLADPAALDAATALLLLCPQIPLLFMGEETGTRDPFLYFSDHGDPALAEAVREGRRAEFAKFPEFADSEKRARIPDPNAPETFEQSRPRSCAAAHASRMLYTSLLALRREQIVPRLRGARSEGACAIGDKAVVAAWRLGDGARLTLACNLDADAVSTKLPRGAPVWGQAGGDNVPAFATLCWIEAP
jgi:maltooligosyltrehalose trehalohydrolase